jgi:hypothetical protein
MHGDENTPPQASNPNHQHVIASAARQSSMINHQSQSYRPPLFRPASAGKSTVPPLVLPNPETSVVDT